MPLLAGRTTHGLQGFRVMWRNIRVGMCAHLVMQVPNSSQLQAQDGEKQRLDCAAAGFVAVQIFDQLDRCSQGLLSCFPLALLRISLQADLCGSR